MINWIDVLGAYFAISFIATIFVSIDLDGSDYNFFSLESIFVFQYELYHSLKDKLNVFGIIILEIIVTILTFGISTILAVMIGTSGIFVLTFKLAWKLFYLIFKKRN